MPDYIVITTPESERKRQETIFELIYTEQDFFQDLEYVVKVSYHNAVRIFKMAQLLLKSVGLIPCKRATLYQRVEGTIL